MARPISGRSFAISGPFSRAVSAFPQHFPPLYVATIKASERTGNVKEALGRYIAYQEEFDRVRKRAEKTQDAEADKQGASATGAAGAGSTAGAGDGAPAEGAKAQQTQPAK